MAFTTYAAELIRFKDAVNNLGPNELMLKRYEDPNGVEKEFKSLTDIRTWIKYLEEQAALEANTGAIKKTRMTGMGYAGR